MTRLHDLGTTMPREAPHWTCPIDDEFEESILAHADRFPVLARLWPDRQRHYVGDRLIASDPTSYLQTFKEYTDSDDPPDHRIERWLGFLDMIESTITTGKAAARKTHAGPGGVKTWSWGVNEAPFDDPELVISQPATYFYGPPSGFQFTAGIRSASHPLSGRTHP